MNSADRVKATLSGAPADHLAAQPITMTFAGRFAGVPYGEYCRDWRALCRAQSAVAERFGIDMLSLCSDPAREAADCGAPLTWFEDQPPSHVPADVLLKNKTDLLRLRQPDPLGGGRMHDRVLGAQHLHSQSKGTLPVLGWIEGPLAEAANLRGINQVMLDILDDPDWVQDLFAFVCELEIAFAHAQAPYVDMIGIGDAACSLLNEQLYGEVVVPWEKRMVDAIHEMGLPVRLHICGRTTHLFTAMAQLGVDMVDIDSQGELAAARAALGGGVVLLGNVDPVRGLQEASPGDVYRAFADCYDQVGWPFIVGPGCEIPPGAAHENVDAMMSFARETACCKAC